MPSACFLRQTRAGDVSPLNRLHYPVTGRPASHLWIRRGTSSRAPIDSAFRELTLPLPAQEKTLLCYRNRMVTGRFARVIGIGGPS